MTKTRGLDAAEWEFWDTWMRAQRLLTRELDRGLQRTCGISKAEFSVLIRLRQAPGRQMRVGELAESLDWEKSRVAHLLTRMEAREFVHRTPPGARRTGVALTDQGRRAAQTALASHATSIRRYVLDTLTPDQAAAIRTWSQQTIDRIEPPGEQPR